MNDSDTRSTSFTWLVGSSSCMMLWTGWGFLINTEVNRQWITRMPSGNSYWDCLLLFYFTFFLFFFFSFGHTSRLLGFLVPWPATELWATAVKVPSPNTGPQGKSLGLFISLLPSVAHVLCAYWYTPPLFVFHSYHVCNIAS